MTTRIQQISRSMNEHQKESQVIMSSQIAEKSLEMLQQMNQAVQGLTNQANSLQAGANHFKF